MSQGRQLLKNVANLGAFKVAADVSVFLMFLFLARHYGRGGIGTYAFAMALTSFIGLFSNFGFEAFAVREVARNPAREGVYFGNFILLGLILCPLLLGVTWGVAQALGLAAPVATVVIWIGLYQILYFFSQIVVGRFKARNEMRIVGLIEAGLRFAILVAVVAVAWAGAALDTTVLVFPLAVVGSLLVASLVLRGRHPPLAWRLDPRFLAGAWPHVWPFGIAFLLQAGYVKIDVLMLGLLRTEEEVGIYSAAYRPVYGLFTVAAIAAYGAYPVFSRLFVDSRTELRRVSERFVNHTMVLCGLIAVGMACLARPVMLLFYGQAFLPSVPVFRLFALLVPITCLNGILEPLFGAVDQQRYRMRMLLCTVVANMLVNVPLILFYGYYGALAATLLSQSFMAVLLCRRLHELGFGLPFRAMLARLVFGAGGAFGLWWLARPLLGEWGASAAALFFYGGVMLASGGTSRSDLVWLLEFIRRRRVPDA